MNDECILTSPESLEEKGIHLNAGFSPDDSDGEW